MKEIHTMLTIPAPVMKKYVNHVCKQINMAITVSELWYSLLHWSIGL